VSTVSTVNIKDQMFLVLFAKVFGVSEKYFKKVRANFANLKSTVWGTVLRSYRGIPLHTTA